MSKSHDLRRLILIGGSAVGIWIALAACEKSNGSGAGPAAARPNRESSPAAGAAAASSGRAAVRFDTASARIALTAYLNALADRDYSTAAQLFGGDWHEAAEARGGWGDRPDTLTTAGFFRGICGGGSFHCGLRLRRVTDVQLVPPDTVSIGLELSDRSGNLYKWGPCCGGEGSPESKWGAKLVPHDSGYVVLSLPLYTP